MTNNKMSLSRLSSLSGSDKHVHGFTEFYEKFIRETDPDVVCEIGMGGLIPSHWEIYKLIEQDNPGGSSRMWLKYFPKAKVFVMDNFSQVSKSDIERVINELVQGTDGRYTLIEGDQSVKSHLEQFANRVGSEIDFLVDDGGHQMLQQQLSFATLFPRIKSGGLYAIEDLHTSYNPGPKYGVHPDLGNTTLGMLQKFQLTGKIESIYMTLDEVNYLENNIDFCELWQSEDGKSATSMIGKK
jgi:demethylmacrocin O-methyltransferase